MKTFVYIFDDFSHFSILLYTKCNLYFLFLQYNGNAHRHRMSKSLNQIFITDVFIYLFMHIV